MTNLKRLPLIAPSDALTGAAPVRFERALLSVEPHSAGHRGLIRIAAAIARDALSTTVPPSASTPALEALDAAERWANAPVREQALLEHARKTAFSALGALEQATARAIGRALTELSKKHASPIDAHADRVVVRWTMLGAHYAASSVVLTLDGILQSPRELVIIPQQAAGAYAYFIVGAGAARNPELRKRAAEQAEWEAERFGSGHRRACSTPEFPFGHGREHLAVQYFHEFLGSHWKDVSDAARTRYFEFTEWAMRDSGLDPR